MKAKIIKSLFLIFIGLVLASSASAATINVNNETNNSIQNAVNNANSGDTLILAYGIYNEHDITIEKSLNITSSDPNVKPIINGEQKGSVFKTYGYTIYFDNLVITNGKADDGGGIFSFQSNIYITNCIIKNNTAEARGGGVYGYVESDGWCIIEIKNSSIIYNKAESGGGIYNDNALTAIIDSSNINYNLANSGAGILNSYDDGGPEYDWDAYFTSPVTITNSNIKNNQAEYIGGGILNNADLTIKNCNITNNYANSYGGGIYNNTTCNITNSSINSNNSEKGAGIYNRTIYSSGFKINQCIIKYNHATKYGGAIFNDKSAIESVFIDIISSEISFNKAGISGGGVCNKDMININSSILMGNQANTGWGGAISNSGQVKLIGNNFDSNKAYKGGKAIYTEGGSGSTRVAQYNRFTESSSVIECPNGAIDARYNWWGTNNSPKSKMGKGAINWSSWLILKVAANPTTIKKYGNSIISANLKFDSNGKFHDPAKGHIMDGLTLKFTTDLGTIKNITNLLNGKATATLNGTSKGKSNITAKLDKQSVLCNILIN